MIPLRVRNVSHKNRFQLTRNINLCKLRDVVRVNVLDFMRRVVYSGSDADKGPVICGSLIIYTTVHAIVGI